MERILTKEVKMERINNSKRNGKKGQIGMEYMLLMGFLTFVLLTVLGVAYYNSNTIKNMINSRQVETFGNKIVTSAESVFYSGEPSKISIVVNIPERISEINISEETLYVTYETSTGTNKIAFDSNVPLTGTISTTSGLREITLEAQTNSVQITSS